MLRTTPQTDVEQSLLDYVRSADDLRKSMGKNLSLPPSTTYYQGMDDFLLQHGRFYDSQPLTDAERLYLRAVLDAYGRAFERKQCFYNSQMVLMVADRFVEATRGMTLRYVEGYTTSLIAIHHGWLTLNGKVIDPTLRRDRDELSRAGAGKPDRLLPQRVVGTFPDGTAYFGVPFRTGEVLDSVRERKEGGSLLIDWKRKFPFLRTPYTVAE